mmetsp:Transcript_48110/g.119163  ORF Transcript_48110/g.119163 Transcript_48110/m.119163 type:complete len:233 (+) Transcript_48110:1067-1765(+)
MYHHGDAHGDRAIGRVVRRLPRGGNARPAGEGRAAPHAHQGVHRRSHASILAHRPNVVLQHLLRPDRVGAHRRDDSCPDPPRRTGGVWPRDAIVPPLRCLPRPCALPLGLRQADARGACKESAAQPPRLPGGDREDLSPRVHLEQGVGQPRGAVERNGRVLRGRARAARSARLESVRVPRGGRQGRARADECHDVQRVGLAREAVADAHRAPARVEEREVHRQDLCRPGAKR